MALRVVVALGLVAAVGAVRAPSGSGHLGPAALGALPAELARHVVGHILPLKPFVVWSPGFHMEGPPPVKAVTLMSLSALAPARRILMGNASVVYHARFFPSGDRFATCDSNGETIIWDARSGRPLQSLQHGPPDGPRVLDLQVFPDGDRIATVGSDGATVIWSAGAAAAPRRLQRQEARCVDSVARVLAGGALLATGGESDCGVAVWNTASGEPRHTLRFPAMERTVFLALEASPCGRKLAAATWGDLGSDIAVWAAAERSAELELSLDHAAVVAIAVSHGGLRVASVTRFSVWVWDGATGDLLWQLPRTSPAFVPIAFVPNSQRLVTAAGNFSAVWDMTSGEQLRDLAPSGGRHALDIVVSPCGRAAAMCGHMGSVGWAAVWDLSTGALLVEQFAVDDSEEEAVACSVAIGRTVTAADLFAG